MEPRGQRYGDRLAENVNKFVDDTLEPWSTFSDVRSSFDDPRDVDSTGSWQDNNYSSNTTNRNIDTTEYDWFEHFTSDSSLNPLYSTFVGIPNYERPPCENPEEGFIDEYRRNYPPLLNVRAAEMGSLDSADGSEQNRRKEKQANLYRCFEPGCLGVSFGRKYDFRRHQANHSSDPVRHMCGECIDKGQGGDLIAAFLRKDKLRVHLRNLHGLPKKETKLLRCMMDPCGASNKEIYFSSQLALDAHTINVHSVVPKPANVSNSENDDGNSCVSELETKDRTNGLEMLDPSYIEANSKYPMSNAYETGAKREKLEKNSRYYAQIRPTNHEQDITFLGPDTTSLDETSHPGEQTSNGIRSSSNSISHTYKGLSNGNTPDKESLWIDRMIHEPHNCTEIKSVRILEMLALLRLNVLPTEIPNSKDFEISFDFRERAIKLKGPSSVTARVKVEVESGLSEVRRLTPKEPRSSMPVRGGFPSNGLSRLKSNFSTASASGPSPILFSIRTREDSSVITTWMAFIEPRLTDILTPLIGGEYSAGLVRQSSTKGSVIPTIRIQSPTGQSKSARDQIRDQINRICELHDRAKIPLQFSKGSIVRLILTGSGSEASWDYEPMEDDQPNEQQAFPHHRRYYPKPGMSSSVGLHGCGDVSATVGGYIQIDTSFYVLTVDHFIGAATDLAPSTPLEVTSPSLLDRNELTELLKQNVRDIEANIHQLVLQHVPSGDIPLTPQPSIGEMVLGALPGPARDIIIAYGDDITAIQRYQSDLNRKAEDYTLGTICQRCHSESRPSSADYSFSSPNGGQESKQLFHRMDWSVSAAKASRRGENQYGQDFFVESETEDPSPERFNPRGAGIPCQRICSVEPGIAVYYFGQTSGLQRGRIGDVPISIRVDQICSMEWTIVLPLGQQHQPQHYQGDSGAWVMRASDNALVGLLWGWINGLLILTPITDVFADIVEAFTATEIRLPQPRLPNQSRALVPICRVKGKNQSQKPRRYTSAVPIRQPLTGHENPRVEINRPLQVPAKEQNSIEEPELMPRDSLKPPLGLPNEIMDTDPDVTTSEDPSSRSTSPVPSLSSSVSSSPTIVPYILPTTQRHSQAGHLSEDTPVTIVEGNDADEALDVVDKLSPYSTLWHIGRRPGKSQQDNRLSLGYILEDLSLAGLRTSDFTYERPTRSSGTWPTVET